MRPIIYFFNYYNYFILKEIRRNSQISESKEFYQGMKQDYSLEMQHQLKNN